MELPGAVEALEILAPFGQNAAGSIGIGEGKDMGTRLQLTQRQHFRALPLCSVGRRSWFIEETLEVILGTQVKCES